MPRWAAKTDDNHQEVMDFFRGLGCSVADTSRLGQGFPDCAIGLYGITVLVEIKDGQKTPSARKLTADEQKWHDSWGGWVEVIETKEQAYALVRKIWLASEAIKLN